MNAIISTVLGDSKIEVENFYSSESIEVDKNLIDYILKNAFPIQRRDVIDFTEIEYKESLFAKKYFITSCIYNVPNGSCRPILKGIHFVSTDSILQISNMAVNLGSSLSSQNIISLSKEDLSLILQSIPIHINQFINISSGVVKISWEDVTHLVGGVNLC